MYALQNLGIHIAHSCNLTCESCNHYSNQGHKGKLSLDDAAEWMGNWDDRLEPQDFSLLGGEPTINPDLAEFVLLARSHWPRSRIRIVTNGFFLHRHPDLPRALKAVGKSIMHISVHHDSPAYLEKIAPNLVLAEDWMNEYGIDVKFYRSDKYWTRTYHGFGASMRPYADGRPRASWEMCHSKQCRQLFEGKIWKCPPLAYLKLQDAKYGLAEDWDPYLRYKPLDPRCTDAELREFFEREEEPACGMCPAKPERFALPIPFRDQAHSLPILNG